MYTWCCSSTERLLAESLAEISTTINRYSKYKEGQHLKTTSVFGVHTQTNTRPSQSRQLIKALASWLYSVYLIRWIHMLPPRWQNSGGKTPFTDEPQYQWISLLKQIFLSFFFSNGKVGLSNACWLWLTVRGCATCWIGCFWTPYAGSQLDQWLSWACCWAPQIVGPTDLLPHSLSHCLNTLWKRERRTE